MMALSAARAKVQEDEMSEQVSPRDRLIVALDLPSLSDAEAMVARLGDSVTFYKVGMELTYAGGLPLAERLIAAGKKVFIDLKLHDIPNTVERATRQIAKIGASFLTVHAYPQTMKAALAGAAGSNLRLLGVTVLTSYDDADLVAAGYAHNVKELVARRASQARDAGMHGLVMSPEEVESIRALVGPGMALVTPGIRPAGSAVGDQKRIMTPALAIAGGADHLVVGRPVTEAADPAAVAEQIVVDITSARALIGKTNRKP
jgi:orotidine-5'-phosphate decarboxylase